VALAEQFNAERQAHVTATDDENTHDDIRALARGGFNCGLRIADFEQEITEATEMETNEFSLSVRSVLSVFSCSRTIIPSLADCGF